MNLLGFNPYVAGGVLLALIVSLGFAGCEHQAAGELRDENASLGMQLASVVDANKGQQTTIDAQSRALNEWMKLGESPDQVAALMKRANSFVDELASATLELAKLKEKDRAIPECAELLRANIEHACPDIARGLRVAADRYEKHPRGDPGAGGEAAAGRTHGGLRPEVPLPGQ